LPAISASVRSHLLAHDWPGNVRELAHYAERFVLGLADGPPEAAAEAPGKPCPSGSIPLNVRRLSARFWPRRAKSALPSSAWASRARLSITRSTSWALIWPAQRAAG
jgi:DNA-binding NtrC family response regulator